MLYARAILIALFMAAIALPAFAQYPGGSLNHPTGTHGLIMVDKVGGRVLFFGQTGDRELSELRPTNEPGLRPHEVAISPDGRMAYVSVYGDGIFGNNPRPGHTIAEIDLASHRMVGSINVSHRSDLREHHGHV